MPTPDCDTDSTSYLLNLIAGSWTTDVLAAAIDLQVLDSLGEAPRSAAELAEAVRCDPNALPRLLRALVTIGVCNEDPTGSFAITPLGSRLRRDHPESLHFWSIYWMQFMRPLWSRMKEGVRTGQSVRKALTGFEGFERQQQDPAAADTFNKTMVELTRLVAGRIARAYDFGGTRSIVDVGGGYGELLVAILRHTPHLTGTLFDLPHAADGARRRLDDAQLSGRCRFVAGDFFDCVPSGADLYLLKSVVHDWPDAEARRILQNCRRAMPSSGRLLLVERIYPDRIDRSATHQQIVRSDLAMLLGLGSQERNQTQFRALISSAGFHIVRIETVALAFSLVEAIPVHPDDVPSRERAQSKVDRLSPQRSRRDGSTTRT